MAPTSLSPRRATATIVLAVAVLQSLMVLSFVWPAAKTAPRDIPVAVAGPEGAFLEFARAAEAAHPGALELTHVVDGAAARAAVRSRDAYGAILLEPDGPRLLVASAASPAVAQLLTTAVASGDPVAPVEDVVATTADDPRGAFLATALMPIVMTSVIAGALLALLVAVPRARVAGVAALAAVGGLALAWIGHGVFGGLDGSYLLEAGVIALVIAAVSATVAGSGSLAGHAGIPPVAILMMLLGNPLSGAASAPEMLPQPWGEVGSWLPPGAFSQALRSVGFFDGAGAVGPLTVLTVWVLLGLSLLVVADRRASRRTTGDAPADSVAELVAA